MDESILPVILSLGPDFTVNEWAKRLDVPRSDVLEACRRTRTACKNYDPFRYKKSKQRMDEICDLLASGVKRSATLVRRTGWSREAVLDKLGRLKAEGKVVRVGAGQASTWELVDAG